MYRGMSSRSQDPGDEKAPSVADVQEPSLSVNQSDTCYTAYSNTISEELLISDGEVTQSRSDRARQIEVKVQRLRKTEGIRRVLEENELLKKLQQSGHEDDKHQYALATEWIDLYKRYLKSTPSLRIEAPGKVDNRTIEHLIRNGKLKESDYFTVSEDVAVLIFLLYGGGPVMTLYNIHEMQDQRRIRTDKLKITGSSLISSNLVPRLGGLAEKSVLDTITQISARSITSGYSRQKKTLSSIEMRYANSVGLVPTHQDFLDDSGCIMNCPRGDSPARSMDEEESSIRQSLPPSKQNSHLKQDITSSEMDTLRSADKTKLNAQQSQLTEAKPTGEDFTQSMQRYINMHRIVPKPGYVDFKKKPKDFIFSKISQSLSTSKTALKLDDHLSGRYNFPGLNSYRLKFNSLENTLVYCYLNSVLQFLFCVKELVYYFNLTSESRFAPLKTSKAFKNIVDQYQKHDLKLLNATELLACFRQKIQINVQQDVDELLRLMFDHMQQELKPPKKKHDPYQHSQGNMTWTTFCQQEDSIFTYLFAGETKRRTICLACQHRSEYSEPFDILSLSLVDTATTIEDLFESNFGPELIEEGFACSGCKQRVPAASRLVLTHLPRYLLVQLKRFSMFPKACKSTQKISCSPDGCIDLHRWSGIPLKYKLVAAVHHSGSIGNGHYRVSGNRNDKWVLFDDDQLYESNLSRVLEKEAYLLMFRRCD